MVRRDGCHTLQNVHFARAGLPVSLYMNASQTTGCDEMRLGPVTTPHQLDQGSRLSTDSYFNSFYVSYWREFTHVRKVGVRVTYRGGIRAGIWLCDAGDERREMVSQTAGDAEAGRAGDLNEIVVWLDDAGGGEHIPQSGGRLFVEIEALALSEIHSIAYVTDTSPLRDVTLSVGICTYNREAYLAETLKELIASLERNEAVKRVRVVNQGRPFQLEGLKEIFRDGRFSLIEQCNLGGCGGFNRTMHEALMDDAGCTHHLLMDDDIIVDGRILDTAISFLRYAEREIVLGGHMLDAAQPTMLYEAGAVFDPLWFIVSLGKGRDIGRPEQLGLFNQYRRVDYNAWWFCIVPVNEIREAGFSPPIFIRGDDIDYGCRLAKRGIQTVALPAVAVWHELFFSKIEWQQYYDIRNRLILSAVHGDLTPQPATHFVFGYILECLLTHRYAAAIMCMAGISDFLLGPDRLFAVDPAERHRRVTALGAKLPPASLDWAQAQSLPWGDIVDRPGSVAESTWPYFVRFVSVLFLPYRENSLKLFRYNQVHPVAVGNAAYVMTDARSAEFVQHTPRRRRVFSILARSLFLIARFRIKRKAVNAEWVARIGHYQTLEAWQKLFALDRDAADE